MYKCLKVFLFGLMIPLFGWSETDTTLIFVTKSDSNFISRPLLEVMVKDIYQLEACEEERDSLYSLISIKDERIEVKDSLLYVQEVKSRQKDVIIFQDEVIIDSQADELKGLRKQLKTQKFWKGFGFTLGGISLALNIALPIYYSFRR